MRAEIIAVGSELTSGAKLDTNSQWLSQQLTDLGIVVHYHTSVADDLAESVEVLRTAALRTDFVLMTGGLGPTLDDLTRQTLAEMANVALLCNDEVLETIRAMFTNRGRAMPERNEIQAHFPAGSEPLSNPIGTAPGIWQEVRFDDGHVCRIAAMPGVPSEMTRMFDEQVRPRLPLSGETIVRHRINCFGIGESHTEQLLGELTARGGDPEVGITVHEATITLRITAQGRSVEECHQKIAAVSEKARQKLGHYVYGIEDEELEDIVVRRLIDQGHTLATVESGTGGLMSHRLMNVVGSEGCFSGGLILPTPAAQQRELGLESQWFADHGAVSEVVARELAARCRDRFTADFALAITTDRADTPSDQDASQPAAFVALATAGDVMTLPVRRLTNPHIHRSRTVKTALDQMRLHLDSIVGPQ